MALLACLAIQGTARGEAIEKGVITLVEFPDVKHDVKRNFVQERFSRGLNHYIKEMSYNKVYLEIDVTKNGIKCRALSASIKFHHGIWK